MKTKRKKNKKAGMIRNLLFRELTGKNTQSMKDDSLAIEDLRDKEQKRNNIALKEIEYYKKITDDANTNDLNDIKVALVRLSDNLKYDLLLEEDKQDLRDFKLKLIKKRNELDNKRQRTSKGKKRKRAVRSHKKRQFPRRKTRRGRK